MIRVSDYITHFLYQRGISHIFLVSGGGAMHLNDSIALFKKIKWISHHHEQAAAIAAEAYSRVTEKFGVAMVSTGPGSTNAITGLLSAWQDSIPCIFISGQNKRKETILNANLPGLRQFGQQEVNIIPIVQSITKFAEMINDPEKIRYILEKAIYLATSGRPGPVWLDVPLDVQAALVDPRQLIGFGNKEHKITEIKKATTEDLNEVVRLLNLCRKPLLVGGNGIRLSKGNKIFLKLVHKLKIPVITSNIAIDLMDYDDPYFLGLAGMKGRRSANIALRNCDLLISIGCRLAVQLIGYEYSKFAPVAKKIVVDIDKNEHRKKTIHIDLLIESDAKFFIEDLLQKTKHLQLKFKQNWTANLKNLFYKYPSCLPSYAKIKKSCNMYYAINKISEHCGKEDIIITDAGLPYYMVAQGIKIKNGQRFILPGGIAALGYSLPAAIGAAIAAKNKKIICITGDGSLQTNIHELGTIAINKLPIKIFILNNEGYLSIRTTQRNYFEDRFIGESKSSGLGFPNISKIADAYGIKYFYVKDNTDLKNIIPKVIKFNGPVLCEISCVKWQAIVPNVTSQRLADGTMVSSPIDDMSPLLPATEMEKIKNDLK